MPVYRRRIRVAAPLSRVWEFHSTPDGLAALTPDWMDLRIESVRGPDGDPDPELLEAGSTLRLSVRPFGIGPRRRWTSRITERERADGSAVFRDEMVDGPFRRWEHTHRFFGNRGEGDAPETVVDDEVAFELPFGRIGEALGPAGVVGFEPMFRYRHRRLRELIE